MPLFVCSKCKCIENTALAVGRGRLGYWGNSDNPLCSECLNGKWHNCFKKEKFDEKKHKIVDGFVEYL